MNKWSFHTNPYISCLSLPGQVTRRDFLRTTATLGGTLGTFSLFSPSFSLAGTDRVPENKNEGGIKGASEQFVTEAKYYRKLDGLKVECELCPKKCIVADMERGACGVRENRGGVYYTLVMNRLCSFNIDPIEKKPLNHFLPATNVTSIATPGCNFECRFCLNWQISQFRPEEISCHDVPPEAVVEETVARGIPSIAYTYSEPVVFFEYMYEVAKLARARGIKNVVVSNGYIEEKPLRDLCKVVDAIKIDLKAFTDSFYTNICAGTLKPVLRTLKIIKEEGVWNEIVVLLVTTLNDGENEIRDMCKWVVEALGPDVPMHFSRFHKEYMLQNLPDTPIAVIERARRIAVEEGVKFAYVGNVPGHKWESTYCPKCGKKIIGRVGFYIASRDIKNGTCAYCGESIPGVWR